MAASPQTEAHPPVTELIVLYDPLSSAPSVAEVLDAVNLRSSETLRSSLGSPDKATKAITRTPTSKEEELSRIDPYAPAALLHRLFWFSNSPTVGPSGIAKV
jgi:hypothetical protein